MHTLKVAQGRFTRVCVEIDMNQPVVGSVGVDGCWYNVEYEGLHIICAQCGCYGHLLKDCPSKPPMKVAEEGGDASQKRCEAEKVTVAGEDIRDTENQGIPDLEKI